MMSRRMVIAAVTDRPQARRASEGFGRPFLARRACGLLLIVGVMGLACGEPTQACSLCPSNAAFSPTFRQEAALRSARVILHGTISNPRLTGESVSGQTDFTIKTVLRSSTEVKGKAKLVLGRYLPVNKGETPHYLLFCDVDSGKIDPYRAVPIKGESTVAYVQKALVLSGKSTDTVTNLAFYFRYLDNADPEVARDAFIEFARATDADIARAAPRLDADKLRGWIKDKNTSSTQVGVYALLLGAHGKAADADFLRGLLDSGEQRYQAAFDGLLAGYMQLRPKEGWALVQSILGDGNKSLTVRLSVVRTLRFQHGAHTKESLPQIVKAMHTLLAQGELADIAVEDMRRWELWDLAGDVFKLYGQKGFDAPLMKRAVIRYALCCKKTEAGDFLKARRAGESELVQEVEESLKLEKGR
jgi:hypothetical protein